MTNFKHLTQIELSAYYNDTLEKAERQSIGRHLLNCTDCRKRLPLPSVERFWAAIMTDSDTIDAPVKAETEFFHISIFARFSSFLKLQSGLLWGGALLIIIFSFSFLLLLSVADSSREVVQTLNNGSGSELGFPLPTKTPTNETRVSSTNSNRVEVNPTPKITKREVTKQMPQQNNVVQKSERKELTKKEQISEIRGVSTNCNEDKDVELEFSTNKENFVFKWKKVPNAVKYHLYISDDEEILIDEFETERETTFILKKSLDPLKSYKWKIIVTLENGKTLLSSSQKFKVNNFQKTPLRFNEKKTTNGRCLAND